ncbi:MAG TPA: bifunctional anthranilate synthase component II/anthranilate phosphoribosyltransferase [Syntrophomonadaceae bacterium]|nr:bifunctional anthranilate synthase component II/anthranilate phosphoribosyltransferase [Syntrophomonadaceae bacterium]
MILVIDNYDSFTYNLVQYLGELGEKLVVYRNDRITVEEIRKMAPSAIVISPGPGKPADAGITPEVIKAFSGSIPILGVCLGHQAIGEVFGGRVVPARRLMHGKTSEIYHDGRGIFRGVQNPFTATRYHSLAVDRDALPSCLEVSAWTRDGEIMGLRHREYPVEGVQFHPESVLTESGKEILKNFLRLTAGTGSGRYLKHARKEGRGMQLTSVIEKVVNRYHLSEEEAEEAMGAIMSGEATPAQIASLLTALRLKGETVEEITGFARAMRARARRITPRFNHLIDTCGTGGDQKSTFNISTTAAFVVAGAGLPVAKHGNRSVSSKCGSADVLEALGVKVDIAPEQAERCLEQTGICFLFAPVFHEAMKHAVGPRREIGIRTVFNILGPLTNPAGAQIQLLGVYDPNLTGVIARVLRRLGSSRAMVVHGEDGLDEITHTGRTRISELVDGEIRSYEVAPEDLGLKRGRLEDITGNTAEENARITLDVLNGRPGPCRDVVLMNAGAALLVGGKVDSLKDGVRLAAEVIDSGAALRKLRELIDFTGRCA